MWRHENACICEDCINRWKLNSPEGYLTLLLWRLPARSWLKSPARRKEQKRMKHGIIKELPHLKFSVEVITYQGSPRDLWITSIVLPNRRDWTICLKSRLRRKRVRCRSSSWAWIESIGPKLAKGYVTDHSGLLGLNLQKFWGDFLRRRTILRRKRKLKTRRKSRRRTQSDEQVTSLDTMARPLLAISQ